MAEELYDPTKPGVCEPCQKCGAASKLVDFEINGERRTRFECSGCGSMTMHYANGADALAEWKLMQKEARAPRALGEG